MQRADYSAHPVWAGRASHKTGHLLGRNIMPEKVAAQNTSHTWMQRSEFAASPGVGAMAEVGSVLPASAVGAAGPAPVVGTALAAEWARADAQRAAADRHLIDNKTVHNADHNGNDIHFSTSTDRTTASNRDVLESTGPPLPPVASRYHAHGSTDADSGKADISASAGVGGASSAATHVVGLPFIVEYVAIDPDTNARAGARVTTGINSTTSLSASAGEPGVDALNETASALLSGMCFATRLSSTVPNSALLPATVPAPPGSVLSAAATRGARTYAPSPLESFLMTMQPRIALGSVPRAGKPLRQPFMYYNSVNSAVATTSVSISASSQSSSHNGSAESRNAPSEVSPFGPAVSHWPAAPAFGIFSGVDALSVPSVVHPLSLLQRPRQPEMLLQSLSQAANEAVSRAALEATYHCSFAQRLYRCFQLHVVHIATLLLFIVFPILLIYRKHVGGSYSIFEMWPAVVFVIIVTLSCLVSLASLTDTFRALYGSPTATEEAVSLEHVVTISES